MSSKPLGSLTSLASLFREVVRVRGDEKGEIMSGFLIGERIYLRSLEKDDLIYIRKWVNDPEIRALTGEVEPMTQAGSEEYFERLHSDRKQSMVRHSLKGGWESHW